MKRFALLFLFLSCSLSYGADIQGGETFSDGQSVTAARLNNHVNGATIVAGFIANKSNVSAVGADSLLLYQASSSTLKRTDVATLQSSLTASPTFTGTITFNGATVLAGEISPAQITSDQNDYNPTSLSTSTTLRLFTDAIRSITGLQGGIADRIIVIHNIGSSNVTFKNQNASSSAANRFDLPFSNDLIIPPGGVELFQYDSTSSRWRNLAQRINFAPAFTTLTDAATVTWTLDPTKVSQNATVTLGGSRCLVMNGLTNGMTGVLKVVQDGTGSRKLSLPGPTFTDGVGNNTTTFTSATATFVAGDVGRIISQPGNTNIPAGTTIASRSNATTVVLSATCTTATGITFYLPGRQSLVSGGGTGAITLTTTASATDVLTWIYDGTYILWTKGSNFN